MLLANGVFAMAEISLVASRKAKLKTLADEGHHGAKLAHNLALAPGKFLSTVQVGITLVGTLAGAFGGAGIAQKLEVYVANIPGLGAESSHYISLFIVVAIITYFSSRHPLGILRRHHAHGRPGQSDGCPAAALGNMSRRTCAGP